jgi:Fe-S cluster assembly scaffold protein SufB
VTELDDGIDAHIILREGTVVEKPVHFCFGMFPETGVQQILLTVNIEKEAKISLLAHCTFPNAVDVQHIKEAGHLVGEGARGVLTSRIAVSDYAKADVYNDLKASAPYTRGHVDCKEIIQGHGVAQAVPIVEVAHPKAHVTHEAAIGSVDNKQLETLMARGLSEDEAVDLIIEGLLS